MSSQSGAPHNDVIAAQAKRFGKPRERSDDSVAAVPVRPLQVGLIDELIQTFSAPAPTKKVDVGASVGGRFVIKEALGSGGMGTVYRAYDEKEGVDAAVKVMQRDRARDDEARARFEREADILFRLDHPGIVKLLDFGINDEDETPWIAMELLNGETLHEFVSSRGELSPMELVPILSAIASALGAAHIKGVVHRDLKPDNIFMLRSGESMVKILDFGLSMSAANKKVTQNGALLGTPRYMAPEQLLGASKATKQSDVYSLGVIVYEALCGVSPFEASDQRQLLGQILQNRIRPIAEVRPDLPVGVAVCIDRALAGDPAVRYRTPGEFDQAFAAAAMRSTMRTTAAARQSANGLRLQPIHIALGIGVILLIAAVAAVSGYAFAG